MKPDDLSILIRHLESAAAALQSAVALLRKGHSTVESNGSGLSSGPISTEPQGLDMKDLKSLRKAALEILTFLNVKTGRRYQPVPANVDKIVCRLKEGASVQECKMVIAKKCREWGTDEKMQIYLRPETLFNRAKFASYQGELVQEPDAE